MKRNLNVLALLLLSIIAIPQLKAQTKDTTSKSSDHTLVTPDKIKWVDAPPSLPPGAKVAVIDGDPSKPGIFTMRVKIPANYKIMPHTHPADEHVTVLEGTCYLGMGEKIDEKTSMKLPTGGFIMLKTGSVHYFYSKGECTLQLHGMGPWGINYINPKDDPRNTK